MSVFTKPLAQAREAFDYTLTHCTVRAGHKVEAKTHFNAALDLIERQAGEMETALRELLDAVRILDVMLREPAAKGLMSAEDYRSYLSGAWLGVDEKTAAARAALSTRKEQK